MKFHPQPAVPPASLRETLRAGTHDEVYRTRRASRGVKGSFLLSVFAVVLLANVGANAAEPKPANVSAKSQRLHRWTNLSWEHSEFPLFLLHGPFDQRPDGSSVGKLLRETKSALDVYGFREVVLASDERSISMTLNDQDEKELKKLATKNRRGWFVAVAPPKEFSAGTPSVAVVAVAPPMEEGRITFSHVEAGSIAQNLRRRFRIAEFRLEP